MEIEEFIGWWAVISYIIGLPILVFIVWVIFKFMIYWGVI